MLVIIITLVFGQTRVTQTITPDEVVFWQVKPFIYIDENNKLNGMLPFFYTRLKTLCNPSKDLATFYLINQTFTQNNVYKTLEKTSYKTEELKNVTGNKIIFFPVFVHPKNLSAKNLVEDVFLFSKVAVIVHKKKLYIANKVFEAILMTYPIMVYVIAFILIVSTTLWLAECINNKDFSKRTFKGFGTSLYLVIVTFVTVGYGDVVPKSLLGRFITTLWMIIGLYAFSGLTGTFSAIISTNSFLNIKNKKIAVLKNSWDFDAVQNNYGSRALKEYISYEEILFDVNVNQAEYGVINVDFLLSMDYKEKYKNVVLVQILNIYSPVLLYSVSGTNLLGTEVYDNVSKCLETYYKEELSYTIQLYQYLPIVETDIEQSLPDILLENYFIRYTGIAFVSIIVIFFIKDAAQFTFHLFKKHK